MKINDFVRIWEEKTVNDKNKFILYIDIPFCIKQCSFCIFNPNIIEDNRIIKDYIDYVLLNDLQFFHETLKKRLPDVVYFGGGSPSLLTESQIERICNSIPNFMNIKIKAFECHPKYLTKKKIEYLLDKGFSYFSMGIQTFNKEVLNFVHRDYFSPEKLLDIVSCMQDQNAVVSIDLIAFLRKWCCDELIYSEKDLLILTQQVKPNIIVVHPNYKTHQGTAKELKKLNHLIKRVLLTTDYYANSYQIFNDNTGIEDLVNYAYNLYHGDKCTIFQRKQYDCSGPGILNPKQSVLGLGGLGKRKIYSYIGMV